MFSFNFSKQSCQQEADKQEIVMKEAKPCSIVAHDYYRYPIDSFRILRLDSLEIKYLMLQSIEKALDSEKFTNLRETTKLSDLVPGLYEGGLKVWECSFDLVNYLMNSSIEFQGSNILELGCGMSLPSILCWLKGSNVMCQDYNEEVLHIVSVPNFVANSYGNKNLHQCSFVSGDWATLPDLLKLNIKKFNVILTSETIYNPESYSKLYEIFLYALEENGLILVAAKSHYFGVGGSVLQFMNFIQSKGIFVCRNAWESQEGLRRHIIEIKRVTRK